MFSFICFFINVQKNVVKKRWDKYNIKIKGDWLRLKQEQKRSQTANKRLLPRFIWRFRKAGKMNFI